MCEITHLSSAPPWQHGSLPLICTRGSYIKMVLLRCSLQYKGMVLWRRMAFPLVGKCTGSSRELDRFCQDRAHEAGTRTFSSPVCWGCLKIIRPLKSVNVLGFRSLLKIRGNISTPFFYLYGENIACWWCCHYFHLFIRVTFDINCCKSREDLY